MKYTLKTNKTKQCDSYRIYLKRADLTTLTLQVNPLFLIRAKKNKLIMFRFEV